MIYFFSGSHTQTMIDYLMNMPGFEPFDVLVSQLDKSGIRKTIEWKNEGIVNKLFIDSGAFSVHTGKANVTVDQYIDFLNSIDEHVFVCAQLDTIPGKFGQPKSPEDYVESSNKSWENFLYMRKHLKSPNKLMPVFHYGEPFDVLNKMISWKDENGKYLEYVGISPANDVSQGMKNIYMREVYDLISKSKNPNVKTHLYGMTSLDALRQFPCYSADSISHRLLAGYCKVFHPEFGVISVSNKSRTSKTKSNMSFIQTADEFNIKKLTDYVESLNVSLEQIQEDPSARVAVSMYGIMQEVKKINENGIKPAVRSKRLF